MPKVVPDYKDRAKKRILDAAISEFSKKGYRETTMDDIAKQVGVSKAALYRYFKSKQMILGTIGEGMIAQAFGPDGSGPGPQDLGLTFTDSFEKMLDAVPKWFPGLLADLMAEVHRDEATRQIVEIMDLRLVGGIAALLEQRKAAGEIRKDADCKALARALNALQLGLIAALSTGLPKERAVEAWREVVRVMEPGLRPK